ncbi:hypothetical protein [Flavobacterium sp.]|uniref:hypothetical protein n=1 Tax=Flavobacterium sp. TaxID=239 RepID=UPI00286E4D7E|nr:hypothetical protein [Flavobacterium sp.]
MENTKKIVFIIISFLFLSGCTSQKKEGLSLPNNLFKDSKSNIIFRVPLRNYDKAHNQKGMTIKNDSINFSYVYDIESKEYRKNNDVIDWKTFKNIFNDAENEKKVNFDDQSVLTYNCYFEDKNNFYMFPTFSTSFIMIKNKSYDVLGGAYLKINNEIYHLGIKVESADIKTFKTLRLRNEVDYYRESIGMDKNYLYSGNSIMTYDRFKRYYSSNKDLKSKYFKDQKE